MKTEFEMARAVEERRQGVEQMNAALALEGYVPNDREKRLQEAYIAGVLTLEDLILDAHEMAKRMKSAESIRNLT